MLNEAIILMGTAAIIGILHTLMGPDHYLPFIAISKARNWTQKKTALITFICGIGHVASSVVLGFLGILLGIGVSRLEFIEASRGELAAWLLIGFGLAYTVWGIHQVLKKKVHVHKHETDDKNITPWILFIIFVFGPCEPLIPILMYPAAKGSLWMLLPVTLVFAAATIGTMLAMVLSLSTSLAKIKHSTLAKYAHPLAGFVIFISGAGIKFLGL
ncbi:sulfite exporter TauE/SafE family protein [Candidatus Altiarchaeota archaeon]